MIVSIRAPARGATWCGDDGLRGCLFQSAPPHGGRLGTARCSDARSPVSIRAPARGATSTVGACPTMTRFNPRPRTGGDTCGTTFQSAPPHGGRPRSFSTLLFNPRPRTGGDRGLSKRPEELRLAWSLRELCMVVDVTHPCNTFVSSQHLC